MRYPRLFPPSSCFLFAILVSILVRAQSGQAPVATQTNGLPIVRQPHPVVAADLQPILERAPFDLRGAFARRIAEASNADAPPTGMIPAEMGVDAGSFLQVPTYRSGGFEADSVAVADVNEDGKPDLIVANNCASSGCSNSSVSVLLGNGDGTFQAAVSYGAGGEGAQSVVVADVNGDGKPDIIVANNFSNTVSVLLGNGDGTFQAAVNHDSGGFEAVSAAVADVNGDGKPDIIVANLCASGGNCLGPPTVGVLLGRGDGTFKRALTRTLDGYLAEWVAVADVNGDGKPDIIVAIYCNSASNCDNRLVDVLLGNGDGTFRAGVTYDSGGYYPLSVAIADVNRDGTPDIIVANNCASTCNNSSVGVLLGNGDGTFQTALSYDSGGWSAASVTIGDVNGDGKPDIIVANNCANFYCSNGSVAALLGNGDGTFQAASSYDSGGWSATSVTVGDVNGDGRLDLVVADDSHHPPCPEKPLCSYGAVGVLLGNGDGTFQGPQISDTTVSSSSNPGYLTQPITFTATVTGNRGSLPRGSVTFKSQLQSTITTLGTVTLNSRGRASLSTSFDSVGVPYITAVYSGDANYDSSSSFLFQSMEKIPTTTALASNLNPSTYGQAVTFRATITHSLRGTATGTVTFAGKQKLGIATVSGGTARLTTREVPCGGPHSILAKYSGDSTFAASTSPAVEQKVTRARSATSITSSPNPSVSGQAVTFTATITSPTAAPTGTVNFKFGATELGAGTLSGSGVATFTTSTLPVGSDSVTADYDGNCFVPSTASMTQVVNP
jgi:Bacterial Ig-like domain (group 3)/FG-GAP-like repeat/FG-GAP repeat